jgi:hypothetical protein
MTTQETTIPVARSRAFCCFLLCIIFFFEQITFIDFIASFYSEIAENKEVS